MEIISQSVFFLPCLSKNRDGLDGMSHEPTKATCHKTESSNFLLSTITMKLVVHLF